MCKELESKVSELEKYRSQCLELKAATGVLTVSKALSKLSHTVMNRNVAGVLKEIRVEWNRSTMILSMS